MTVFWAQRLHSRTKTRYILYFSSFLHFKLISLVTRIETFDIESRNQNEPRKLGIPVWYIENSLNFAFFSLNFVRILFVLQIIFF